MCLQIHRCRIYFSIAFQRPSSDVYLAVLCHTHTRVVPGKHVHEACPPSVFVLLHSALCASSRTVMLDVVFQLYVMSSTSRSWECFFCKCMLSFPFHFQYLLKSCCVFIRRATLPPPRAKRARRGGGNSGQPPFAFLLGHAALRRKLKSGR